MNYRKIPYYGLFAALAILMGYVEFMIPVPVPIPGVKLGLANVIVIIMLYFMDAKSAFFVSLIRVLLSGLLFAGFAGMLYSMAGALCSFAVMVLLQRTGKFSMIGVSVAGGIFHNIGQIVVASLVVQNVRMAYYLPFLLVSGVVTGVLIGIVAQTALKHLSQKPRF